MNILITLPKHLIEKIILGEKKFEMRKCLPKYMRIGVDGFFVVEKGTDDVRCWCRVDETYISIIDRCSAGYFANLENLANKVKVSENYIEKYANGKKIYLWKIGKVNVFECLGRGSLGVDKNPQQFAYCPLSYGESF